MDLQLRLLLDQLFENLEGLDYYAVLGVEQNVDGEAIRRAFYDRAELMHPDRHYNLVDTDLREKLYLVYKRVAEAYRVLGIGETRREYDQQLARGRKRYQADTLKDIPKDPEMSIRNIRARKLYLDAQAALKTGNAQGALLALKMAEALEPDNALVQQAMAEVMQLGGFKR
ncbi:MAG TPA: J domain-containing protein [Polyangia bacterium]|nr:J domain-containing protein [Polyangia bacterium]